MFQGADGLEAHPAYVGGRMSNSGVSYEEAQKHSPLLSLSVKSGYSDLLSASSLVLFLSLEFGRLWKGAIYKVSVHP